jgi:capsular polysaccharide transport system ATP-binding protein
MRSKLIFAISMAADFECYLLDEVLSVSDFALKARATALFEEKRKGASLILVSHSTSEISKLCDMGAIMAGGTLRMFEDVNDAVAEYERVPLQDA